MRLEIEVGRGTELEIWTRIELQVRIVTRNKTGREGQVQSQMQGGIHTALKPYSLSPRSS